MIYLHETSQKQDGTRGTGEGAVSAHLAAIQLRLDLLNSRIVARRAYARQKRRTCGRCFERVRVSEFPAHRAPFCKLCVGRPAKRLKWTRWVA